MGGGILLLASCGTDETVVVRAAVKLLPPDPVVFASGGGSVRITVKTNQDVWDAVSVRQWCEARRQGGELVISCTANDTREYLPEATVTVTAGSGDNVSSASLTVIQEGMPPADLTTNGPANCFIVPAAGDYRFDASVRGKSAGPPAAVPHGSQAAVVWATSEGLLELDPTPDEQGRISFSVPDEYRPGNAVVALTDGNEILWSWHLWLTDKAKRSASDPFMNINLGATDDAPRSAGSLGLMYQWGRKDPFPGAAGTGDWTASYDGGFNELEAFGEGADNGTAYTSPTVVNEALAGPWRVDESSEPRTHEECAATGTTFYGQAGALPDNAARNWSPAADPCPAGWHVPEYREMSSHFTGYASDYTTYQGVVLGEECYWPATGYRNTYGGASDGRLRYVGRIAIYWTGNQRQYAQFGCGVYFDPTQIMVEDFMVSYGLPVRCISDDIRQTFNP